MALLRDGGLAYGHVELNRNITGLGFFSVFVPGSPPCPTSFCPITNFSNSDTRFGWTIGAGVEAALFGNWSVKAEYLFMDLGTETITFATVPGCFGTLFVCNNTAAGAGTLSTDIRNNIVRVGLNYRFGGTY